MAPLHNDPAFDRSRNIDLTARLGRDKIDSLIDRGLLERVSIPSSTNMPANRRDRFKRSIQEELWFPNFRDDTGRLLQWTKSGSLWRAALEAGATAHRSLRELSDEWHQLKEAAIGRAIEFGRANATVHDRSRVIPGTFFAPIVACGFVARGLEIGDVDKQAMLPPGVAYELGSNNPELVKFLYTSSKRQPSAARMVAAFRLLDAEPSFSTVGTPERIAAAVELASSSYEIQELESRVRMLHDTRVISAVDIIKLATSSVATDELVTSYRKFYHGMAEVAHQVAQQEKVICFGFESAAAELASANQKQISDSEIRDQFLILLQGMIQVAQATLSTPLERVDLIEPATGLVTCWEERLNPVLYAQIGRLTIPVIEGAASEANVQCPNDEVLRLAYCCGSGNISYMHRVTLAHHFNQVGTVRRIIAPAPELVVHFSDSIHRFTPGEWRYRPMRDVLSDGRLDADFALFQPPGSPA
jgi:hypothetical protein